MASRLLLLPGGLNPEHIDRIRSQPLWNSLWPGQSRSPSYICICEQGRRCSKRWEGAGLKAILESLLQSTPDCRPTINIVDLGWANIEEHLARCDVFYMCGGEPHVFADLFRTYQRTMGVLQSIIRSGRILYIGSCGGACMMSSSYAGVRTMEAIPGMISVSHSIDQIGIHSGDAPPVTMTTQTGLIVYGEQPQAFVITRRGVCKHQHLVEMLEQQVRTSFRIANSTQFPGQRQVVEAPPPPVPSPLMVPSPAPTQLAPPVLPLPAPTQPSANADQPFAGPAYVVRQFHVGANLIKMYIPSGIDAPMIDTRRAVLYLASTKGEEAPIQNFQGSEIVYAPQFTSHGRHPWKNGVPDWLVNWVAETQANDVSCRWSLFGFSRGAAWGGLLAADVRLRFHRVLLVAPYVLPSCSADDRLQLKARLPMYERNLLIVFGSADPWQPCSLIQEIKQTSGSRVFEGLGHEASLAKAVQELWLGLFFPF